MFKVITLLFVTVAFVCAKPKSKNEVIFGNIVQKDPHQPVDKILDVNGTLTYNSGYYCNGSKRVFSCDGSCYDNTKVYRSFDVCFWLKTINIQQFQVTGFNDSYRAVIAYFSEDNCADADSYMGIVYADPDLCYGASDVYVKNVKSFACIVISKSDI
jgi:hypothetical protein